MIIALLVILAIAAFVSWRTYKPLKGNSTFYTWVVVALVASFLAKRMVVGPQYMHVYLAVSIILGQCLGVFLRTWEEW